MSDRPHIVLVVPRGEAVRNFVYSQTLPVLAEGARVTLLSVVDDDAILGRARPHLDAVVPLAETPQPRAARYVRSLTENAHDRWLWSRVAQNHWQLRDRRAGDRGAAAVWRRRLVKTLARGLANRPALAALTALERRLQLRSPAAPELDALLARLRPDLVFNCSHIHGLAGELPLRLAARRGIPTAGFIFSWDNLTSRSRIFVPYGHYLVWFEKMKRQLLDLYRDLEPEQVSVTGTPQLDYHFRSDLEIPREDLCAELGIDPDRPYVLYTTGIDNHFFDEHRHVESVIELLAEIEPRPQLVVRTYVKGTSEAMYDLARRDLPDVVFPGVRWESRWQTPLYDDLAFYSNLLRHAAVGINAASTVSLELLIFDKPVINLDFDPPGSELPWELGYERHIRFDHYWPVATSGAVMVARSREDMRRFLRRGLDQPDADATRRRAFLAEMFGDTLDGAAGRRVAEALLRLARADG